MNKKVIRYEVVTESSLEDINSVVEKYIQQEWQPFGGISRQFIDKTEKSGHYTESVYSQAMVKYSEE